MEREKKMMMNEQRIKLKKAFDSATSADEMLKALQNMAANVYEERELGHQIHKYIKQRVSEGTKPLDFMGDRAASSKWKGTQVKLQYAFHATKTADEMLNAFTKMEPHFQEQDLAADCFRLAQRLHLEQKDPEKMLFYGKRALKVVVECNNNYTGYKSSMMIPSILRMLGSASCSLKRYEESLSYLNWGLRNLSMLESDKSFPAEPVLNGLVGIHAELAKVKTAWGREEEVVVHLKNLLETREKLFKEGDLEIGKTCMGVAAACLKVRKFEEALPFSLRALEMYAKQLGDNSVEIARARKCIGDIQEARKECDDEALEQNRLLMRFKDCIDAMHAVVMHDKNQRAEDIKTATLLAKARDLCNQKNFVDAKKYMKMVQRILDKIETKHPRVATGLEELAKMYEQMNDFGTAISLLRRALAIPKLPQTNLVDYSSRLFSLISLTGTNKKGIIYLEDVVERLKGEFGPNHCQVGYGYKRLGDSYIKLGKLVTGAKFMALAKDVMDVTLGPHHLDSLEASQTLSRTYADLKSYDLALEIQEKVVKGFKGLGQGEQGKLDEAAALLKQMKERASSEGLPDKNAK